MQIKKATVIIIVIILLVLLIAGCVPLRDTGWVSYRRSFGAFGDHGYYYITARGCLYFLDLESSTNVCLCTKIGCPHDTSSDPSAISNCEAYISGAGRKDFPIFYSGGGLYYVLEDEYGTHLMRRNADGSGLHQVGTFCKSFIEEKKQIDIQSYICAGDYLYYCADIYEINDIVAETEQCVLRRMNLKSGKDDALISVPGHEYLSLCAAKGNSALYQHYVLPERNNTLDDTEKRKAAPVRLFQWEAGSSKNKMLLEKTFGDNFNYKTLMNNAIYYTTKENGVFVTRVFDLTTKIDKTISDEISDVYITEEYTMRINPETKMASIYHLQNREFLPTDFESYSLGFCNASEKGIILSRGIPFTDDPHVTEKKVFFYVPYDVLSDGLQKSDTIDFYVRQNS